MTAETITRQEIECLLERAQDIAFSQVFSPIAMHRLIPILRYALNEHVRLSAAREAGVREGIEMAARHFNARADAAYRAGDRSAAAGDRVIAADVLGLLRRIPDLAPVPAEAPTTPTAEESDGWIEWRGGGECPVAHGATLLLRFRDGSTKPTSLYRTYRWRHTGYLDDIIAYRVIKPAEASAPVAATWDDVGRAANMAKEENAAARIAALEAEVAALREGLRPFGEEADEWDGVTVRADDADPVFIGPEDVMETAKARFVVGDLRRARALLQGQGGADAS